MTDKVKQSRRSKQTPTEKKINDRMKRRAKMSLKNKDYPVGTSVELTNVDPTVDLKRGTLLKLVDPVLVFNLAKQGFPMWQVRDILDISARAFAERYGEDYAKGKQERTTKVLNENLTQALNGNDKALEREMKIAGVLETDKNPDIVINVPGRFDGIDDDELLHIFENEPN